MNAIQLHAKVWDALLARRDSLPHALLLAGQKGIGKSELAVAFARLLLCEAATEDKACGQCLACHWFEQGNHPDFRLVQPLGDTEENSAEEGKKRGSQQITVEQIRGLDEFLNVGTHRAGLKIIIIRPAEAMNRNTANSLLKTLEEPPPNTLFLLVTDEANRLLPTIRSRCQVVNVSIPESAGALAFLRADDTRDPERWLALAGGAPLLAKAFANGELSSLLSRFTAHLASDGVPDPLTTALDLEKQVKESKRADRLGVIVELMQKWTIDLTLASHGLPVRYFVEWQSKISKLAAMIRPIELIRFYRTLGKRRREAEQPLNPRLFLEGLFLEYRSLLKTEPK